jgi:hypothetical protein
VSEEEAYRAQGFVEFEGEWMTPAEQQSIQAARQEEEAAASAAADAQVAAHHQAMADREAQELEESDAYWNQLPQWGDPLYGAGWGAGAVYWPTVGTGTNRPNRPANRPAGGRR